MLAHIAGELGVGPATIIAACIAALMSLTQLVVLVRLSRIKSKAEEVAHKVDVVHETLATSVDSIEQTVNKIANGEPT